MCGIFGITVSAGAELSKTDIKKLLIELYKLSETRGKESAGIHVYLPTKLKAWTIKGAISAIELIKEKRFHEIVDTVLDEVYANNGNRANCPLIMIAHSRLVTNGSSTKPENNQPIRYGSITVVHNGIIVNIDDIWRKNTDIERRAEVDTEVLAALLQKDLKRNLPPTASAKNIYKVIRGAASIGWVDDQSGYLNLATNTGDIFYTISASNSCMVFASENYILDNAIKVSKDYEFKEILKINPGWGVAINTLGEEENLEVENYSFEDEDNFITELKRNERICCHQDVNINRLEVPAVLVTNADETLLRYNVDTMKEIKRCGKCVLPETFPFISFDDQGICNYCHSYKPYYKGRDSVGLKSAFLSKLEKYRSESTQPDVLVPFSGGRDSCYGLHLIKREFGFNPITFTYDWGMVTDLARRNTSRLCGELGVPNILVSANIKEKRNNINKNVSAWLKKPDLGMVPLFMAGDKHFFKIVNDLKRQTGIKLDLWSANPLENTDFKSGFCGIKPDFDKSRLDYLSISRKIKIASYYGLNFLTNPSYINYSLIDTLKAFVSYYIEPRRDFFFMFNHIEWNEHEVNKVIIDQYDFELSPDSPSTWRIGDGTAPFYNYIYMTTNGFTEFDTFRSNQIREGQITREFALDAILEENRPRFESLKWYLESIELDFNDTVKRINQLDFMGLHL